MSFKDIKMRWDGADYVIPPNKMLGAIARIEDVITLEELSRFMTKCSLPRSRLAQAFGAVLRYAGATVSDEEIYEGMFGGDKVLNTEIVVEATTTLLSMIIPPASEGGAGEANPMLENQSGL